MEIIEVRSGSGQQVECGVAVDNCRLKRETFFHPRHYPSFSPWKVLIGPSDWEDHSKNKEGAERYRVHNLPNCFSCPGLYELGIALRWSRSTNKLNEDQVIPVYLGQADNVRTRLQHYGRMGAHLEDGRLSVDPNDFIKQGNRLFSEVFFKGYAIVYRWAPMKSKQEAEKTEADLLDRYDFAWNKRNNGTRRHYDILDEITSKETKSLSISRKILNLCHSKISIHFDPNKPLLLENGSVICNNQESNDVFPRILKFGRSNPWRITVTFGTSKDCADICGVVLGHGCVCTRPPVQGRKRCAEHKGMKINDLESKLIVEHKSVSGNIGVDPLPICGFTAANGYVCTSQIVPGRKRCEEHKGKKIKEQSEKSKVPSEKTVEVGPICGVNLEDGSFCTRQAVIGRKRCEEHKGRWIKGQSVHIPKLVPDTISCSSENSKSSVISGKKIVELGPTCGVNLEGGTFCSRSPVEGRKRCWQHKGMRVYGEESLRISTSTYYDTRSSSNMCGAGLRDGSICRRVPVQGRKRCEQHKGMRVYGEGSLSTSTSTYYDTRASSNRVYGEGSLSTSTSTYYDTGAYSNMCGAGLRDGSICRRVPVRGRKRCEQHKGMRATFW